jgi:hypothetical protein
MPPLLQPGRGEHPCLRKRVRNPRQKRLPATKKRAKGKKAKESDKKLSALDAAAKILVKNGEPMQCQPIIQAMAAKGYWKSPGGKTPHAQHEIKTKGSEARFQKVERGKFAAK